MAERRHLGTRQDTTEDAASIGSVERPPSHEEGLEASKVYHPLSFPVIALLMPASIFGVLTRLGLQTLATYDDRAIFPLAYAQAVGCLVMGIVLELKEPIGQFYAPLYTALATGFCGSVTTFSGWQLDVFNSWVNATRSHRGGLRDFVDGLSKTVFTLAISITSVNLGAHIVKITRPYIPLPPSLSRNTRHSLTALSILVYAATLPAYFKLSVNFRHQATAALLFSFPGTLTRYILSFLLNTRSKLFPLGTFTANILGTGLLGAFHVIQSTSTPPSRNACAILQGLADGYCGCLTTISTFTVEINALGLRRAWFYAAISWSVGQLLLLLILGPSYWAGDAHEQVTCRFT